MISNLMIDRNLDVVRDTLKVNPARPRSLDELTRDSGMVAENGGISSRSDVTDVEILIEEWSANAQRTALQAISIAESHSDSPAAWTRSAFAQLSAGDFVAAREHSERAISLAQRDELKDSEFDVPAVVGAIRVLSTLVSAQDLISVIEELPSNTFLTGVMASMAASIGDLDRALVLTSQLPVGEAASLVGYIHLQKNDLSTAIHNLRKAIYFNAQDVDAHFNMAIALFRSGSPKKALRSAGIAWHLSPGRLDFRNFYFELLALTGRWEILKHQVLKLRDAQAQDTPEILVAEARLALVEENRDRALVHLKKAEQLAMEHGNSQLAAEFKGNQIMIGHSANKLTRDSARRQLTQLLESKPESIGLADMLSMLIIRKSEARFLDRYLEVHRDSQSSLAYSFRSRVAYLECRFDDYLLEIRTWGKMYPSDGDALIALISAEGHFDDDWPRAATIAKQALKKLPRSAFLANQVAYCFALAGQPHAAEAALNTAPEWNYRLEATRGLVKISLGDVLGGLKNYRKAAEMVERVPGAEFDSILMGIHQGLALRRLNLLNPENERLIKAAALPVVSLPDDWEEYPAFAALKLVADRHGWSWPPLLY